MEIMLNVIVKAALQKVKADKWRQTPTKSFNTSKVVLKKCLYKNLKRLQEVRIYNILPSTLTATSKECCSESTGEEIPLKANEHA